LKAKNGNSDKRQNLKLEEVAFFTQREESIDQIVHLISNLGTQAQVAGGTKTDQVSVCAGKLD